MGVVAVLAGLDELTADRIGVAHWGWPIGVLLLGVLFVGYAALRPRLGFGPAWLVDLSSDPQPGEHRRIGLLLAAAGVFEGLRTIGWVTAVEWAYAWPLVLFVIAILFVAVPQRGTGEAQIASGQYHGLVGFTVGVAAMLAGLEAVRPNLPFATLWAVALLVAAVELLRYREPTGAWEEHPGG